MKILIDMNLSPDWVAVLGGHGHAAVHWSSIGSPSAPDSELMAWAKGNGHVVFTHDLDFSTILASTRERGPSVIQFREQDVDPRALADTVVDALRQFETELIEGAVVVVEPGRVRARVLPLKHE